MTIISKTAGGASLLSNLIDIHKTAVLYSNNEYAKSSADSFISCALGSQKANRISVKDADRKNWLLQNNFLGGIQSTFGKIGGYIHGLARGIITYAPKIALSVSALFVKNKKIANISAVGLAGLEAYDFVKNSTGLTQRTDYLKL